MTIGFCSNRKFLTLQVKKHEFTPVLPDFLIKCTKPHTRLIQVQTIAHRTYRTFVKVSNGCISARTNVIIRFQLSGHIISLTEQKYNSIVQH